MQLDLFNEPVITNLDPDLRVCTKCGEEKDIELFHVPYYKSDGSPSHSHTCKSCKSHFSSTVNTLKKIYPKPEDSKCECCGDFTVKLVLDHNHKTNEFRGWLCTNCNQALGKLKEDVDVVMKAARYLRERSSK